MFICLYVNDYFGLDFGPLMTTGFNSRLYLSMSIQLFGYIRFIHFIYLLPIYNSSFLSHQFGFRHQHSTIQQVNRIEQNVNETFEHKEYCTEIFLDVRQTFDKVWHSGLLYKIKKFPPKKFFVILKSYLGIISSFTQEFNRVVSLAQYHIYFYQRYTDTRKYKRRIICWWYSSINLIRTRDPVPAIHLSPQFVNEIYLLQYI